MTQAGYQHRYLDNDITELPVGKVVCIGRNFARHIEELNNKTPKEPVLFIKPASSIVSLEEPLTLPKDKGSCHFETELALLIGGPNAGLSLPGSATCIAGYGLGLDLTLRDIQEQLKAEGLPWEKAKAFDGACAISRFVKPDVIEDVQNIQLRLTQNGVIRQNGNTSAMITPVSSLLAYINSWFTLQPGDIVLTGTPEGVGPLALGDQLEVELVGICRFQTRVNEGQ